MSSALILETKWIIKVKGIICVLFILNCIILLALINQAREAEGKKLPLFSTSEELRLHISFKSSGKFGDIFKRKCVVICMERQHTSKVNQLRYDYFSQKYQGTSVIPGTHCSLWHLIPTTA